MIQLFKGGYFIEWKFVLYFCMLFPRAIIAEIMIYPFKKSKYVEQLLWWINILDRQLNWSWMKFALSQKILFSNFAYGRN